MAKSVVEKRRQKAAEVMYRGVFWNLVNHLRNTSKSKSGRVRRCVKLQDNRFLDVHITAAGNGWIRLRHVMPGRTTFIYGDVRGENVSYTVAGWPLGRAPNGTKALDVLRHYIAEAYPGQWRSKEWVRPEKPINERPLPAFKKEVIKTLRTRGFAVEGNR